MKRIIFILTILIAGIKVHAQSLPVGTSVLDDYYRRQQLLGKIDSNLSFSIRPIFPASKSGINDVFNPDSLLKKDYWVQTGPITFAKGLGQFQILPLTWQQQYNSNNPYGWNDGAMIPAKGYQTMVSGGFYLKFGPLSIQLRPEFVYASNPAFNSFGNNHNDLDLSYYYAFHPLDMPERYGNSMYKKAFLGQSSIRLTFGPMSVGLSNENLWWGPGIHNSLILSNNASGFKHVTINTIRPIKTFFGYFEGQIIGAHLKPSGFPVLQTTTLSNGASLVPFRANDKRYFTGFNINYHPKWVSGLTLGITRTFNAYAKNVSGFSGYIPFFTPYSKQATKGGIDDGLGDPYPRDQLTSLYARWLFLRAQAEVYFEYGLNDNSYNLNDFIGSPDHSRAYIFGFRKMIALSKPDQHILFGGEITRMSQSVDRLVRPTGSWYHHYQILEGHTNMGQVLGAGTGPGGNLQVINVNWVSGLKKLGINFERYEHDVDYQQAYFSDINGNSRKWVDFAFGLQGDWNYKNLLFNAKLQYIKSLNYQWILKNYIPGQYYVPNNDASNLHAQLGITYRF